MNEVFVGYKLKVEHFRHFGSIAILQSSKI